MADDIFDRLVEELARDQNAFDRAAKLPAISAPVADLVSILNAVKQEKLLLDTITGRSGSVLDKALTLRDLMSADVLRVKLGDTIFGSNRRTGATSVELPTIGYVDPRPVLGAAPTPSNLEAFGAFKTVILTWDLIDYQNHAYVEIFRSQTDNVGTAVKIGQSTSNLFVDASGTLGQTYYYWVRAVAIDPGDETGATLMTGAFNAAAGTQAGLLRIGNLDLSDEVITADKIAEGAIVPIHFASGSKPVFLGSVLPALPNAQYPAGTIFVNTTDSKVYRSTGSTWTAQTDGADIAAGTIAASKLIANTITAASGVIANAAIRRAMIELAAIDTARIADLAVATGKIANLAVTTAKIADLTVTNAKIVDLHGGKIAANSVTADKIDGRNLEIKDSLGSVILSASRNLDWTRLNKRPVRFRVCARGFSDATPGATAGLFNAETGALVSPIGGGRSYNFARIRRSDGALTYFNWYDVHASGAGSSGRHWQHLANDLNATGPDSVAVVWTFDEPFNNRLNTPLPDAMYRCGASQGVFGSNGLFKQRSAYILVGYGGCGHGNGIEVYRGDVNSSTSAFAELSFALQDGQLVMGAGTSQFKIDANNVSTFVDNAAIGNAQIGNIIESGNYVPGVSGWRINKSGAAEFYNILARGNITATSVSAASGTLGTITSGFLRNSANSTFINLNATGDQTFLSANNGQVWISANGKSKFIRTIASGTWTGAIGPSSTEVKTVAIDTLIRKPYGTLSENNLVARVAGMTFTYSDSVEPARPGGTRIADLDIFVRPVVRRPLFVQPYQEIGQNPYGAGNEALFLWVDIIFQNPVAGFFNGTVTAIQWTLDQVG